MPEVAKKQPEKSRFSLLALIPLGVAFVLGPLMLPRAVVPTTIPIPIADLRAVEARSAEDRARARRVESEHLPDDARQLGQAIRDFNAASVTEDKLTEWGKLRRAIDGSLAIVRAMPNGNSIVLDLRAVQLEHFLVGVQEYEKTGQSSKELDELGGSFIRRSKLAGWAGDRSVLMDEPVLRVAFKLAWNGIAQLDNLPDFDPTTDELRLLYAFYLQHPHAPDHARAQIDALRKTAKTKKDCEALDAGERLAAEAWQLDKVEKLAKIDSAYPADYARGVLHYRAGHYSESSRLFQRWLEEHPNGPLTLRARGHLRAAIRATEAAL